MLWCVGVGLTERTRNNVTRHSIVNGQDIIFQWWPRCDSKPLTHVQRSMTQLPDWDTVPPTSLSAALRHSPNVERSIFAPLALHSPSIVQSHLSLPRMVTCVQANLQVLAEGLTQHSFLPSLLPSISYPPNVQATPPPIVTESSTAISFAPPNPTPG